MVQLPKTYLYRRIVNAKIFIDNHFHEQIDLNNIADEACFSKFHFIRLFKSIYKLTPYQYLTRVRIREAQQLLQKGKKVNEVCLEVGFESFTSFIGLFRKHTGYNPSIYKDRQITRSIEMNKEPLRFIPGCFVMDKSAIFES